MNLTLRIWALSLIIQPICFGPLGLFVIPIELIFSIPGIILFGIIVCLLSKAKLSFPTSYILLFVTAGIIGFLSSYLFLSNGNMKLGPDDEDILFTLPAPIATTLAIAFSYKRAKEFFGPKDEVETAERYYEY